MAHPRHLYRTGLSALVVAMSASLLISPAAAEVCRPKALKLSDYKAYTLPPAGPDGPVDLQARFMGITTLFLDDGETKILIDGFFTRPGWGRLALGSIAPDHDIIAQRLTEASAPKIAAVLTAHAHHDHAMDGPVVAKLTGAVLVGSESVANLGRGHDLPERQIRAVQDGDVLVFGKFKVTPFYVDHARPSLFKGHIHAPLRPPARVGQYKAGQNFAYLIEHEGRSILVHPTAASRAGLYTGVKADLIFLGVGRLGRESELYADQYWRDVVIETGAKTVIPVHWDHFAKPLKTPPTPMPFLLDDVRRGLGRVRCRAQASKVALHFAPPLTKVELPLPPRR